MLPTIQNGKYLAGVPVSPTKFQGVSTLDQLEDYGVFRPSAAEHSTKADRAANSRLDKLVAIRDEIQRLFDKKRMDRAEVYARYIERVEFDGMLGGTPAITLYIPGEKILVDESGLLVPYNSTIIPIDGETQCEARFMLRQRRPDSGARPFAVTVYHSIEAEAARQILVDYNRHVHPMSPATWQALDVSSPLSHAVADAVNLADIPPKKINRHKAKPGRGELLSHLQVAYGAVGLAMGERALKSDGKCWFGELDQPHGAPLLNGQTVPTLARIIASAILGDRGRSAPVIVWQAAGVKAAAGVDPMAFNWTAAIESTKGKGGKFAEKMARVSAVL